MLIGAAEMHIESAYGLVCRAREAGFTFDGFTRLLRIPRKPVDPGTIALIYIDGAGVEQTSTAIRAASIDEWIWVMPTIGSRWPICAPGPGTVSITATVGYDQPADVPEEVKLAVKILVACWFDQPNDPPPPSIDMLIGHYRFRRV